VRNWKSEENINYFIENSFGELRISTVSSEYDIPNTSRKVRIREQKINELLNE
jgi:hypothetical protein